MSKQSEAKERQLYTPKFVPGTCGNCVYCEPVMGERLTYIDPLHWSKGTHMQSVQTGQKCGLGGFAVKKHGSCTEHVRVDDSPKEES
jgi:hypothetical protein